MKYDEFAKGYRASEPNVTEAMIKEAWEFGNENKNKLLEPKEFKKLYYHSMREREAMEYWDKYTVAGTDMSYDQFAKGYRSEDPSISDDIIKQSWEMANVDGNDFLSREEFVMLFFMEEESEGKDDMPGHKELYREFARTHPKKGMTYKEFKKGYRATEPTVTEEMIQEAWKYGN